MSLCQRRQRTPRPVFQSHAGSRGANRISLCHCRPGGIGAPSGRGRPTVPTSSGGLLGGLRAMGQCPTPRSGGRFRGRPKKGLQTALEAEVAQEVEALLGRQALAELDFEALEVALRQRTLRLAAHAIEQRLNADLSDEASALCCPCGNRARYVARRTKNVVSVPLATRARLLSLLRVRPRLLASRRAPGDRKHFLVSRPHAHGGHGRCDG